MWNWQNIFEVFLNYPSVDLISKTLLILDNDLKTRSNWHALLPKLELSWFDGLWLCIVFFIQKQNQIFLLLLPLGLTTSCHLVSNRLVQLEAFCLLLVLILLNLYLWFFLLWRKSPLNLLQLLVFFFYLFNAILFFELLFNKLHCFSLVFPFDPFLLFLRLLMFF